MCDHDSNIKNKYCPDCGVKLDIGLTDLQKENLCMHLQRKIKKFNEDKHIRNPVILIKRAFEKDEDIKAIKWRLEGSQLFAFYKPNTFVFFFEDQLVKINPKLANWGKHVEKMTDGIQFDFGSFKLYYYPNADVFKRTINIYETMPDLKSDDVFDMRSFVGYANRLKKRGFSKEQLNQFI